MRGEGRQPPVSSIRKESFSYTVCLAALLRIRRRISGRCRNIAEKKTSRTAFTQKHSFLGIRVSGPLQKQTRRLDPVHGLGWHFAVMSWFSPRSFNALCHGFARTDFDSFSHCKTAPHLALLLRRRPCERANNWATLHHGHCWGENEHNVCRKTGLLDGPGQDAEYLSTQFRLSS